MKGNSAYTFKAAREEQLLSLSRLSRGARLQLFIDLANTAERIRGTAWDADVNRRRTTHRARRR